MKDLSKAFKKSLVNAKTDTDSKVLSIKENIDKFERAEKFLQPDTDQNSIVSGHSPVTPTNSTVVKNCTFSMPESDFLLIEKISSRFLSTGNYLTKSEILRIGLHLVNELDDIDFISSKDKIVKLIQGRPKK